MRHTARLGEQRDAGVESTPRGYDEVTRDVRHDVVQAASTARHLITALRGLEPGAASQRLLDGVERCAREITAMMVYGPDQSAEVVDIAPLASEAAHNTELALQGKLEVHIEPALVRASSTEVTRLLNNVLENAVRAVFPDGTIALSVSNEDTSCVIRVADSGPGFVERAGRDGIGLAVVAAIAVKLDGEVSLGRSDFGGALVTVRLPRVGIDDWSTSEKRDRA